VDIWSCGVVLFALLSGYLPFEDPNTGKLYKKILAADYQLPDHVSREAADLIRRILTTDPEKRITIPKIRKHPWFNLVECTLPKEPGTMIGRATPPFDI
jgi:5'-AMP-activated protein kinase catalytic alpha subunit